MLGMFLKEMKVDDMWALPADQKKYHKYFFEATTNIFSIHKFPQSTKSVHPPD